MVKQLLFGKGATLEDATKDLFAQSNLKDAKVNISYKVIIKGVSSDSFEEYGVAFADALRKADIEPQKYSSSQYDTEVVASGMFETKKISSPSGAESLMCRKRDMSDLF